MLIELKLNEEKVKEYNDVAQRCKIKYPDMADDFQMVSQLEDEFIPYSTVLNATGWDEYTVIQKDYRPTEDFNGVYVCTLNSDRTIDLITNHKEVRSNRSPIYWSDYGVADNGSQVLDYYESLCEKYHEYMHDKQFVILLHPIFRADEPSIDGWRWHKHGQYIGKYEPKCEYLYDEKAIDYVYCFRIVEVEEC